MNKVGRMAAPMVSAGVMLGIAGCGGPASEYEDLLGKVVEAGVISQAEAGQELKKFKTLSPEKQQEKLQEAKDGMALAGEGK